MPAIPAMWRALLPLEWFLELAAMRPGEMIANLFAALLLAGLVGGVVLVFGKPPWPGRRPRW